MPTWNRHFAMAEIIRVKCLRQEERDQLLMSSALVGHQLSLYNKPPYR